MYIMYVERERYRCPELSVIHDHIEAHTEP